MNNSIFLSLIGVPGPQQKLLEKQGGALTFLKRQVPEFFEHVPLTSCYHWRVIIEGKYSKNCCPEYLKEENFQTLKEGVNRIVVHTGTLKEFLDQYERKDITKFVLLDHMDWFAETPQILEEEWQSFVDHSAEKSKFMFRSAALDPDFITTTRIKVNGKETSVGQILNFHPELTEPLHKLDRVHTYSSFHVAGFER